MGLYRISDTAGAPIDETTFSREGLRERDDLQRLLRQSITILDPGLMVLSRRTIAAPCPRFRQADSKHLR